MTNTLPKITFGMGCFWAGDALFGAIRGVMTTRVGYSGGTSPNPTYRNIGDHTEVIEILYNPQQVKFQDLLELFWNNHEYGLTTKVKKQYASKIFYHDEEQKKLAEISKQNELSKHQGANLQTDILPVGVFYAAEDYHQKYRLQKYPWICETLKLTPAVLQTSQLATCLNGYLAGAGKREDLIQDMQDLKVPEKVSEFVQQRYEENKMNGLYC